MKKAIKYVTPWLSAAAIGGAMALAPVASAAPAHRPARTTMSSLQNRHQGRVEKTRWCQMVRIPRSRSRTAITTRPCRTIPATRTQAAASAYELEYTTRPGGV